MSVPSSQNTFFGQLLNKLPKASFEKIRSELEPKKDKKKNCNAKKFTAWDHFVALLFAQPVACDSLREVEDGLYASIGHLDRINAKPLKRTTLAYVNQNTPYQIFKDFYFSLLNRFETEFN